MSADNTIIELIDRLGFLRKQLAAIRLVIDYQANFGYNKDALTGVSRMIETQQKEVRQLSKKLGDFQPAREDNVYEMLARARLERYELGEALETIAEKDLDELEHTGGAVAIVSWLEGQQVKAQGALERARFDRNPLKDQLEALTGPPALQDTDLDDFRIDLGPDAEVNGNE